MGVLLAGWITGVTFSLMWILIGSPLNFPILLLNSFGNCLVAFSLALGNSFSVISASWSDSDMLEILLTTSAVKPFGLSLMIPGHSLSSFLKATALFCLWPVSSSFGVCTNFCLEFDMGCTNYWELVSGSIWPETFWSFDQLTLVFDGKPISVVEQGFGNSRVSNHLEVNSWLHGPLNFNSCSQVTELLGLDFGNNYPCHPFRLRFTTRLNLGNFLVFASAYSAKVVHLIVLVAPLPVCWVFCPLLAFLSSIAVAWFFTLLLFGIGVFLLAPEGFIFNQEPTNLFLNIVAWLPSSPFKECCTFYWLLFGDTHFQEVIIGYILLKCSFTEFAAWCL